MGTYFRGECFANDADYASAYFSAASRTSWNEGTAYTYVQYYQLVLGDWQLITDRYAYPGVGDPTTYASIIMSPPLGAACDSLSSLADGAVLGWGLASSLVAVAAFRLMQRAF